MAMRTESQDYLSIHSSTNDSPRLHTHGVGNVTLRASDSAGSFVEQLFIVTVAGVNDAPLATEDRAVVIAGNAVTIDLHSNEIDHDGDNLRVGLVSVPAAGNMVLNDDQTIQYTTNPDSSGPQVILYQVDDHHGGHVTSVATVDVLRHMAADSSAVKVEPTRFAENSGLLAQASDVSTVLSASSGPIVDKGDGTWIWTFNPSDGPLVSQLVTVNAMYNQTLHDSVTFAFNSWHNFDNPCDVNASGTVTAMDAILIINYLGRNPDRTGLPDIAETLPWYYEVASSDFITSLDALRVINCISRERPSLAEDETVLSAETDVVVQRLKPTPAATPVPTTGAIVAPTDATRSALDSSPQLSVDTPPASLKLSTGRIPDIASGSDMSGAPSSSPLDPDPDLDLGPMEDPLVLLDDILSDVAEDIAGQWHA